MSAFTDDLPPRPDTGRQVTSARSAVVDAAAIALLVALCGVLALVAPLHEIDVGAVAGGVVLYAIAWQVSFTVRGSTSTALQLIFVPMWFAVPPALLPLVAVAGQLAAWLLQSRISRRPLRGFEGLASAADAWHAVGPALVLTVVGPSAPSMALLPLLVVAAAAQLAAYTLAGQLRALASKRELDQLPARVIGGNAAVDLTLAPLGLVLATVAQQSYWATAGVLPLLALVAKFSGERERRIVHAHELASAYRGTASLMCDVLEADDAYTGGEHTEGVVEMALGVGRELELDASRMQLLELGALLHDIGKLRVPNEIINKPGKLTAEEWEIVKEHPAHGEAMLLRVGGVLAEVAPIVRGHHERFDGAGYPDCLAGSAIPLEARVITVCDSFSAMTTNRSYRQAMSHAEAIAELHRCTPAQFDPRVVDALVTSLEDAPEEGLRIATPVHPAYGTAGSVAGTAPPSRRARLRQLPERRRNRNVAAA
ncbi:MAG: HD-GYP domain-containing protein [Solirubrobacteraceae bacterium]|nr:HD-GYP domain-containing protein [Solirubrobacteraceae bacterium]